MEIITISRADLQAMLNATADLTARKVIEAMGGGNNQNLISIHAAALKYEKPISTLRDYVNRAKKGRIQFRFTKSGKTVYFCPAELEEDLKNVSVK